MKISSPLALAFGTFSGCLLAGGFFLVVLPVPKEQPERYEEGQAFASGRLALLERKVEGLQRSTDSGVSSGAVAVSGRGFVSEPMGLLTESDSETVAKGDGELDPVVRRLREQRRELSLLDPLERAERENELQGRRSELLEERLQLEAADRVWEQEVISEIALQVEDANSQLTRSKCGETLCLMEVESPDPETLESFWSNFEYDSEFSGFMRKEVDEERGIYHAKIFLGRGPASLVAVDLD